MIESDSRSMSGLYKAVEMVELRRMQPKKNIKKESQSQALSAFEPTNWQKNRTPGQVLQETMWLSFSGHGRTVRTIPRYHAAACYRVCY